MARLRETDAPPLKSACGARARRSGRAQRVAALPQDVEMQCERLGADLADVCGDAQPVIEPRRPVELAVYGLARQEDVVLVEHARIRKPAVPKQLRLGDFEEPHV